MLKLILGPKYSPAATTCRQLRQLSLAAAQQLVIQYSSHRPALLAGKLTFARSLPALTDLTILGMPSECDADTVNLLAGLTMLTQLAIPSQRLQDLSLFDGIDPEDWHEDLQHTAASLAAALSGLTRLRELQLPGNMLCGSIQQAVSDLTSLSYLDLSDNNAESDDISVLSQLTALHFLDLSARVERDHKPVNLDALTELSLRTLLVEDLSLHAQGRALAAMTGLRRLEVDGKGLDADGVIALRALTALTHLGLDQAGDVWSPSLDRTRLVHPELQLASVLQLTALQSLTLPAALLARSGATVLLALTRLQALELVEADFDHWGPAGLASLTGLTHLQLPNSCMTVRGAAAVATLPAVVQLNLDTCGLDNQAVQALAFMTGLRKLNLGSNRLFGAQDVVAQLSSLTELIISNNELGDAGMQALASLTALRCLHASWVDIGNQGLSALAQLTRLTRLDFCSFTAGGGHMQSLAPLTALRDLCLWGDRLIELDGRAVLALPRLQRLKLRSSSLTQQSKTALAVMADERHVRLTF